MITAFEHAEYVVSPSGSCAYMLKEYPEVFKEDLIWATKAQALADKTYEFTEFIVNVLKINDVGAHLEGKATYHTSCHMTRLLGVTDAPFQLLKMSRAYTMWTSLAKIDAVGLVVHSQSKWAIFLEKWSMKKYTMWKKQGQIF